MLTRLFVTVIGWLVLAALAAVVYLLFRRAAARRRSFDRLYVEADELADAVAAEPPLTGLLRRWLYLAGYRDPSAPTTFVAVTSAGAVVGISIVFIIWQSGVISDLLKTLSLLPPAIGDMFLPVAYLMPWLIVLLLTTMPWFVVRSVRRKRVEQVEQDLPIMLELLSTLSEAGLGFDAALSRVLDSIDEERPLAREFRTYQSDLLAGRTRVDALRRLSVRLDVASVTILVSALTQAEQLGSGIAQALHRQAQDLRERRRERANAFSMALPVKRMFPLVICFMPGLFVWTLGPFFVQLFQMADTLLRVKRS